MELLVPQAIDDYSRVHTSRPSALLQELEAYTIKNCADAQMSVGTVEGALLQFLIKISGARRVLEIGLFTGYSALAMAEALPEGSEIISCEINAETAAIARSFFDRSPHGGKITIKLGPALATLDALAQDQGFDLVFIDADKENYCTYYEAVLPRLRAGGLVIADNVLWSGRVLKPEQPSDKALVRFNDMVRTDPRVEHVLLTVRDGVMLIRKK